MPNNPNLTITLSGGCSRPLKDVAAALRPVLSSMGLNARIEPPTGSPAEWEYGYDGFTSDESVIIRMEAGS